jgi:hypothetical protein
MADFSATDVAFTGFRFVRKHPRAVALWAAIQLVISLVAGVAVTAIAGPAMMQMQALRFQRQADPTATMALLPQILPLLLLTIPFSLIFHSVLFATMNRAVLRPGENRLGYLRLGMDEVRQLLLLLLIAVIGLAAEIVGFIVVLIPAVIIGLIAKGLAPVVPFVAVFVLFCALAYAWVRLSLASALTFDGKRVDLFGSWKLTRGRFWKIFGTYVLAAALALIVGILVLLIAVALVAITGGGIGALGLIFRPDMSSVRAYLSPVRLVMLVVSSAAAGLLWPVVLMPQAAIYKSLTAGDVAVGGDPAASPLP